MSIKCTLRTIATAVIFLGLASTGPDARAADEPDVDCAGASCDVIVTVTGSPAAPTVAVSANRLRMAKRSRNVMITWRLNAPGYEFRRDSIAPHTGAAVGTKQTTMQAAWDAQLLYVDYTDTTIRWRNNNSAGATLYYDVKIYHKATGVARILDPAIINDP